MRYIYIDEIYEIWAVELTTRAVFVLTSNYFRKCFSIKVGVWQHTENTVNGKWFPLWPENTLVFGVKWFPLLFSLQSISRLRHAQRERERERERREIANLETDSNSDEPRNRLRLTQKTQDRENPFVKPIRSHPENPFNRTISDPHHADCTTSEIVAPQHRSTQNRSFSSHPKTDRSRAIFVGYWEFGFCFFWVLMNLGFVLDLASSSSTQIHHSHSSNPVASFSLSLNLIGFDEFFLLGFVFLCLFTEKWY